MKPVCYLLIAGLLLGLTAVSSSIMAALPDEPEKVLASRLDPLQPSQQDQVRSRLMDIFNFMEMAEKRTAIGGDVLLRRAYAQRNDIGPMRSASCIAAITAAWEYARSLGAFNRQDQFTGRITKGPDVGQALVFEMVVPATLAPDFVAEYANYRVVPPSRARQDNTPVTHRETTYLQTLEAIGKEDSGRDEDKVHAETWQKRLDEAGVQGDVYPKVRLGTRFKAGPSQRNGYKWQVEVVINNASQIPTEVSVECYLLGRLWKSRKMCALRRHVLPVKLKGSQMSQIMAETLSRDECKRLMDDHENLSKAERGSSRASYLGAVILVKYRGGHVAHAATHPTLLKLLNEKHELSHEIRVMSQ